MLTPDSTRSDDRFAVQEAATRRGSNLYKMNSILLSPVLSLDLGLQTLVQ